MRHDVRVTDSAKPELDAAARAQVAEFLRMTPAERLRSLVNTVDFIERARRRMPAPGGARTTAGPCFARSFVS